MRLARSGRCSYHEPDDVRQRRKVAQLEILVARNVVDLADGSEHLRLLDGVDAEVGFQIEIEIQHVLGIAGLLDHECQDALLHVPLESLERCGAGRGGGWRSAVPVLRRVGAGAGQPRSGRRSCTKRITWASVGKSRSLTCRRADAVGLADGGEHLRLLDGVDAEVGFQIEIEIQHV